jgi:hypothetical protein
MAYMSPRAMSQELFNIFEVLLVLAEAELVDFPKEDRGLGG